MTSYVIQRGKENEDKKQGEKRPENRPEAWPTGAKTQNLASQTNFERTKHPKTALERSNSTNSTSSGRVWSYQHILIKKEICWKSDVIRH
jgi:hypothetical protein